MCMENYSKKDARDYCANWNTGKCLGCMMYTTPDNILKMKIDSELANKDCVIDKGCDYFDMVVVPSIPK